MSHYKPYPVYKESGVEWIGSMPEHWSAKPIKIIASCNDDSLPESLLPDTPIRYVDISSVSHDEGIAVAEPMLFGDAPSRARRKAQAGDVVVSTVRTYLKAVASIDEAHADCVYSTGFAVLRPRKEHLAPGFLKWLALNELLIQAVESHSEGLSYPAINASELINLKTAVPSLCEQVRIVSILDRETARIDALISKKTEFIELLIKKRQALITHAVTKGLNPKAKMKDSGVEWIGEVPEHWSVRRLKNVVPHVTVGIVIEPSKYYVVNGVPALRSLNVRPGRIVQEGFVYISVASNDALAKSKLKTGDLVAVRSGQTGATAVVPPELDGCNCIDLILIRKPIEGSEHFLCHYLNSHVARTQFAYGTGGSVLQHFNIEMAKALVVASPPVQEQMQIVEYLGAVTRKLDMLGDKVKLSIDLLKKRRSALITAAVTGQIDLRSFA